MDLSGPFSKVLAVLARRVRERRTARELEGLSDRMLRDIGLRRDQIRNPSELLRR